MGGRRCEGEGGRRGVGREGVEEGMKGRGEGGKEGPLLGTRRPSLGNKNVAQINPGVYGQQLAVEPIAYDKFL